MKHNKSSLFSNKERQASIQTRYKTFLMKLLIILEIVFEFLLDRSLS